MLTLNRHCERSEAIQNKWIAASRFALLVMTMIMLIPTSPACALSCIEPSLARDISGADIVFEGRVTKIDRDPGFTHSGTASHFEEVTYYVTKAYKGVDAGQVVKVIQEVWMPLAEGASNWVETQEDMKTGIVALKEADLKAMGLPKPKDNEKFYHLGMCSAQLYEATPENRKLVEPRAAQ